jgi:putative membrane-bound dehydrogenase-like protein
MLRCASVSDGSHFWRHAWVTWFFLAAGVAWSVSATGPVRGAEKAPVKSDLPDEIPTVLSRFEPLTVEQAKAAFDIADGYRIELVASEPLVVDPVAFCFDPAGRMIVVEMRGYSERPDDKAGRIRRLTDTNGDGVMDIGETLVEGLSWPTAVESWPGGVIVGVPPNIVFYPVEDDANGQAKVGPAEVWFSGFSRSNVQGMMNSFRWGADLKLHGTASSNGAELSGVTLASPMRIARQDFAIDSRDRSFHLVTGGVQHGMDFDRWGYKFGTSNSDHLQQMMLLPPSDGRSTRYASVPPLRRSIAADGAAADVYRSSPTEPWRLLRTHLRMTGQVPGVVEGGGRAAGYFTGATGTHIYKGDQWPVPAGETVAVVCDVGSNLVHRKRLSDDGLWKIGHRIDKESEFVRSSDTWFRPVQLGDGPDGALYIADMYREVIEHPASLPPVIKSQVDLNSGNDRGRIWRVVADKSPVRRSTERLDLMTSGQLVELLSHPNFWQRRTAARLLVHRKATDATDLLKQVAGKSEVPEARFEAIGVLHQLQGKLDVDLLAKSLRDVHPEVRRRALGVAIEQGTVLAQSDLSLLLDDESPGVRFLVAYGAMSLIPSGADRLAALLKIAASSPADAWLRWAVEGSLGDQSSDFLVAMQPMVSKLPAAEQAAWFKSIGGQVLGGDNATAVERLVAFLNREPSGDSQSAAILRAIASDLAGANPSGTAAPLAKWARESIAPRLIKMAEAGDSQLASLGDQMTLVGWADPAQSRQLLGQLLSPLFPASVQQTALVSLVRNDTSAAETVTERLSGMTPATREIAITSLASRVEGQAALARAIDQSNLSVDFLSPEVKRLLGESRDEKVRMAISKHLEAAKSVPTGELYQSYAKALDGQVDLEVGQTVFKRVCASCHEPEPGRERVGPDLLTVIDQPREQILLSILDPSREVNPKYARVQVVTLAGEVISGVVSAESDSTLTLIDSQGKTYTIAREDIDELQTSPKSLMPEELNKEITPDQMRHLIAYVTSRRAPAAK